MDDFQATYITAHRDGDVGIARFTLDSLTEEENIEQVGRELFLLVEHHGWRKMILSMDGVRFVASSALGKLISLHRKLHRSQGQLVICDVGEEVGSVLNTSRLSQYFRIAEDVEAAGAALRRD